VSADVPVRERQLIASCAAADVTADAPVRVVHDDMVYSE
jgi:hypothetical protein